MQLCEAVVLISLTAGYLSLMCSLFFMKEGYLFLSFTCTILVHTVLVHCSNLQFCLQDLARSISNKHVLLLREGNKYLGFLFIFPRREREKSHILSIYFPLKNGFKFFVSVLVLQYAMQLVLCGSAPCFSKQTAGKR